MGYNDEEYLKAVEQLDEAIAILTRNDIDRLAIDGLVDNAIENAQEEV
jgi:ribosomal 50S subunit-associated protein YjgA (DUF615 family)